MTEMNKESFLIFFISAVIAYLRSITDFAVQAFFPQHLAGLRGIWEKKMYTTIMSQTTTGCFLRTTLNFWAIHACHCVYQACYTVLSSYLVKPWHEVSQPLQTPTKATTHCWARINSLSSYSHILEFSLQANLMTSRQWSAIGCTRAPLVERERPGDPWNALPGWRHAESGECAGGKFPPLARCVLVG